MELLATILVLLGIGGILSLIFLTAVETIIDNWDSIYCRIFACSLISFIIGLILICLYK
jgi:hypothetical protein